MGVFVLDRDDLVEHGEAIRARQRRGRNNAVGSDRCPATRSENSSPSRPSAKATGRRSAASSTAVRRALRLRPRISAAISIAARPARARYTSQRHEADEVEILSGVFEGRTTGTPIALLIRNTDARSKDYDEIVDTFRPGHADYTYWQKYGIRDPRGGGRASARETTMRVAAGVIAKKWLAEKYGVSVRGHLAQIGDIVPRAFDWDAVEQQSVLLARCHDGAGARELHHGAAQVRRLGRRARHGRRRRRAAGLGRADLRQARRRTRRRR